MSLDIKILFVKFTSKAPFQFNPMKFLILTTYWFISFYTWVVIIYQIYRVLDVWFMWFICFIVEFFSSFWMRYPTKTCYYVPTLPQNVLRAIALDSFNLIKKMKVGVHFFQLLSSFTIRLSQCVVTQDTALMIAVKIIVCRVEVKKNM